MSSLKFRDLFVERVWGGDGLARFFGKQLPAGRPIGESWEVSAYPGMTGVVTDGPCAGVSLDTLCREFPHEILGEQLLEQDIREFPLLIKFIDARELLSVQVHPDDAYARRYEKMPWGKCEMWYILQAEPGARLIYGLAEEVSPEEFLRAAEEGTIERYLHEVEVCAGDVMVIPPGCVHALGGGIIICEVQESSDLTYRIYDWGRVGLDGRPRALHLDKALEVIDFSLLRPKKGYPLTVSDQRGDRQYLSACQHYAVELITIEGKWEDPDDRRAFHVLSVVEGTGRVVDSQGSETGFRKGESLLLPAMAGNYRVEADRGVFRIIRAYVPDLVRDIIEPLRRYGFSDDEIVGLGGEGRRNDLAKLLGR